MASQTGTRKRLSRAAVERRRDFKIALLNARKTQVEWCEEQGFTAGHLYQVLVELREHPPTLEKVDAFIAKHVPERSRAIA